MTKTDYPPMTEREQLDRSCEIMLRYRRGELGPVESNVAIAVDPYEGQVYTAPGCMELAEVCPDPEIRKRLILTVFGPADCTPSGRVKWRRVRSKTA